MLKEFRPLTAEELGVVRKKLLRMSGKKSKVSISSARKVAVMVLVSKDTEVAFDLRDPFSLCVLKYLGSFLFVGITKRIRYAPNVDEYKESTGRNISLTRASEDLLPMVIKGTRVVKKV